MNCENYQILIDDLIADELDIQSAKEVNLHIFGCSECADYYKILQNEKQIYSRYLFDVEPANNLWQSLQQKIELENKQGLAVKNVENPHISWQESLFAFFSVKPVFALLALFTLTSLSFIVWNFTKSDSVESAQKEINITRPTEIIAEKSTPLQPKSEVIPEKIRKIENQKNNLVQKVSLPVKKSEIKPIQPKKSVVNREKQISPLVDQLNNEQTLALIQARNLEREATKQIERTELLLRSFRNTQIVEGNIDIDYEKQLARKLLIKNAELRQLSETYGNIYTREILDKAEPFLLDIANLENNPSAEKITEIKERVRNQNIIASLQIY